MKAKGSYVLGLSKDNVFTNAHKFNLELAHLSKVPELYVIKCPRNLFPFSKFVLRKAAHRSSTPYLLA